MYAKRVPDNTHTSLWWRCEHSVMHICIIFVCAWRVKWPGALLASDIQMSDDGGWERTTFLFFSSHLHTNTGSRAAHSLFHFPVEEAGCSVARSMKDCVKKTCYNVCFVKPIWHDVTAGSEVKQKSAPLVSEIFLITALHVSIKIQCSMYIKISTKIFISVQTNNRQPPQYLACVVNVIPSVGRFLSLAQHLRDLMWPQWSVRLREGRGSRPTRLRSLGVWWCTRPFR